MPTCKGIGAGVVLAVCMAVYSARAGIPGVVLASGKLPVHYAGLHAVEFIKQHREPAIAWWPGHIKPGETDQLAISLDLMPTCLELAGVTPSKERPLDGVSLLPVLLRHEDLPPRELFWNKAMRAGPWKLMLRPRGPQLFPLSKDLSETKDLADQFPERVNAMVAAHQRWHADVTKNATPQPTSAKDIK